MEREDAADLPTRVAGLLAGLVLVAGAFLHPTVPRGEQEQANVGHAGKAAAAGISEASRATAP